MKATTTPDVNMAVVVSALEAKAKPLIAKLNRLEIKSKEDFELAALKMKELKILAKAGQDELREFLDPIKALEKKARSFFEPFQSKVSDLEITIKDAMKAYLETQAKAKAKLEQDFESGKIARPSTYLRKAGALEVEGNVRNTWAVVVVDETKTPREYLTPDIARIKEALKAGEKVAGWKLEQQQTIAI